MHTEPHPLAGKTVKVEEGTFAGQDYRVEDWWDTLGGKSWRESADAGNPACLEYMMRSMKECAYPPDNEVVYGKIGSFGKLIHVSQLGEVVSE